MTPYRVFGVDLSYYQSMRTQISETLNVRNISIERHRRIHNIYLQPLILILIVEQYIAPYQCCERRSLAICLLVTINDIFRVVSSKSATFVLGSVSPWLAIWLGLSDLHHFFLLTMHWQLADSENGNCDRSSLFSSISSVSSPFFGRFWFSQATGRLQSTSIEKLIFQSWLFNPDIIEINFTF